MKKYYLLILLFTQILCYCQQDSTIYIYEDSVCFKTYHSGDTTFYDKGLFVVNKSNYEELYKNDTLYYYHIYEQNARFDYHLNNGNFELKFEVITFTDSIQPYYKDRCKALTNNLTRCKRKGNPFCWQHKQLLQ